MEERLLRGREAYSRHAWEEAYSELAAADGREALDPEDLDMLARAAYLTGRDEDCEEYLSRAHSGFLDRGEAERAAESAFWIAFRLLQSGEHARGGGWMARAQRILDESELDCGVRGLVLLPQGLGALAQGDAERALEIFTRAHEIGSRFRHRDLLLLSRLGRGQALIRLGRTEQGIRLLDEVMVGVTAGDASEIIVGIIYCAVIETCHEIFDLRRAREWTMAFSKWCAAEPDVVPFRGECLIRRAEIMQLHGEWSDAMNEALRARDRLTEPPGKRAAGAAFYREAELHRLRGEYAEAEKAYHEAERWGRDPHPGFALLRLAQDEPEEALSAIGQAVEHAPERRRRANLLPAFVEITLAAGQAADAREAADELLQLAGELDAPYLDAVAAYADGCVRLREDRPREALTTLRRALTVFREVDAPYESARTLVQIGAACRTIGDAEACAREREEARAVFARLRAAPDLQELDDGGHGDQAPGGLTPRELEVLALIATGKTNRAIADDLYISEKTVARHVSNIFNKLGISSRAAATAFAYEHNLTST